MKVAYIRVSSAEQNEARQIEGMKDKEIERYFTEKISGKDMNRPQLQEMLSFVREGDTVYVHEFSRLGRSTEDLLHIIRTLDAKGVQVVSNKENFDTRTPQGKLMLTLLAGIAEFERDIIRERQREGIKVAKAQGKYTGGKPKKIDREIFNNLKADYEKGYIRKNKFAEKLGVSRPTLDKILKS